MAFPPKTPGLFWTEANKIFKFPQPLWNKKRMLVRDTPSNTWIYDASNTSTRTTYPPQQALQTSAETDSKGTTSSREKVKRIAW